MLEQPYPGAKPYNPNVKFGERPSTFDFIPEQYRKGIREGWITVDLTGWIQEALYSMGDSGGGIVYLPWGKYPVTWLHVPTGVELWGDGPLRTQLVRIADIPLGKGVVTLDGEASAVRRLGVEGQVLVPAQYTYSEMTDPMADAFIKNSSIWIAGGAKDVTLEGIRVTHSGGYAVCGDARDADIDGLDILGSWFINNRPWTAGPPENKTAGGWGGGVHLQGDGFTSAVNRFHAHRCHFRRGTGNQIWSHLYAFDKLHTDFKVTSCHFSDIGRDGILVGGVSGGQVDDCHFRRGGYVCSDDHSPGVPKWVNNQWAVGLDAAGLVRGVNFTNNTFLNWLGACMDGDGYAEGTVGGNSCRVSKPDEPEYAIDNVAAWPGNYCYGFQSSNSNNIPWSARGVNIVGNYFKNLGLGALRGYALRESTLRANTIIHPDDAMAVPILLGNIGAGDSQRANGNSVSGNDIHWSPAVASPAIFEDANGFAFQATDKNWIAANNRFGAGTCFEFTKAATSASVTGRVYSSNAAGLAAQSQSFWQREDGYLRLYRNGDVFTTILDEFDIATAVGPPIVYSKAGPLLNVSKNAAGGAITTGGRTQTAWDDAMATGKLAADAFLALSAGTFTDFDANLLPDTWALLRRHPTIAKLQYSVSGGASLGPRVWQDFGGGGGGAAGAAGQIQYSNGSGVFQASPNFVWDNTLQRVTVTGIPGTAAILAAAGHIQSQDGVYTPAMAPNAFYAPNGGVTAKSLISIRNDGDNGLTLARDDFPPAEYGFRVLTDGSFAIRDVTSGATRLRLDQSGLFTFGTAVSIDQVGNLSASGTVAAHGVNVSGTAPNALQVPAGGIYAGLGVASEMGLYLKSHAAADMNAPPAGWGGLAHKSGTQYWIHNGTAWVTVDFATVGGGVTTITGTPHQVLVSAPSGAVVLSTPQDIHTAATPTFAKLFLNADYGATLNVTGNAFIAGATDVIQLLVRGSATQTANLQEWRSSAGTQLAAVDAGGNVFGQALVARYMPDLVSLKTELRITARQIRFAQIDGDAPNSGVISYTGLGNNYLNIVGPGTNPPGRMIQLWDLVNVYGYPSTAALTILQGYVTSSEGFTSSYTSYQTVNVPNGGVYSRSGHFDKYIHVAGEAGVPTATTGTTVPVNGMFYYDKTLNKFRAYEGGTWKDMIGGGIGTPGSPVNSVQFNSAGSFAGSANLLWNEPLRRLEFITDPGGTATLSLSRTTSPAIAFGIGVDSSGSFFIRHGQLVVDRFRILSSGHAHFSDSVTAEDVFIRNSGGDIGNTFRIDGYENNLYLAAASAAGAAAGAGISFITSPAGGPQQNRMKILPVGKVHIDASGVFADDGTGSALQVTGSLSSNVGYYSGNTLQNCVNIPNGGINGKWLIARESAVFLSAPGQAEPPNGQAKIAFDGTTLLYSVNGTGWRPIGGTGSPGGPAQSVQFNNGAGAFGGTGALQWYATNAQLQVGNQTPVNGARLMCEGHAYFGGNLDHLCIYLEADNTLSIQTVLDGGSIVGYAGYGGNANYLRFQPQAGRVSIGPGVYGCTFSVNGDIWHVNANPAALAFLLQGAPGQTGNLQEWRDGNSVELASVTAAGSIFAPYFASRSSDVGGAIGQSRFYSNVLRFALQAGRYGDSCVFHADQTNQIFDIYGAGSTSLELYTRIRGALTVLAYNHSRTVPLLVHGHQYGVIAGFQPADDLSNQMSRIRHYSTNPSFFWDYCVMDPNLGGHENGLGFNQYSNGAYTCRLYLNQGGNVLIGDVWDNGSGAKLQVTGSIYSTIGLYAGSTNFNAITTPGGIYLGRVTVAERPNPGVSAAGSTVFYMDSSTKKLMVSVNGAAYVDLLAAASLPANIVCTTLHASYTGSQAIKVGNPVKVQIDGDGYMSGQGQCDFALGFRVGGLTVIGSTRNIVNVTSIQASGTVTCAGVLCQGSAIGAGGFNPWNGSAYEGGITGTYNPSATTVMTIRGGVITGMSPSDSAVKQLLGEHTRGMEVVRLLRPVLFRFNALAKELYRSNLDEQHVGFFADEVAKFMPEGCSTNSNGHWTYSDRAIIGAVVNALKQMDERMAVLESRAA